jgi:hypothetical protein
MKIDDLSIHVLGLLRGVIVENDATRHFGSLMAFRFHSSVARDLGLIEGDDYCEKATELGRRLHDHLDLKKITVRRAVFWPDDLVDKGRRYLASGS